MFSFFTFCATLAATQMLVPSNASADGCVPTKWVLSTAPVDACSFMTVLPPEFATQMLRAVERERTRIVPDCERSGARARGHLHSRDGPGARVRDPDVAAVELQRRRVQPDRHGLQNRPGCDALLRDRVRPGVGDPDVGAVERDRLRSCARGIPAERRVGGVPVQRRDLLRVQAAAADAGCGDLRDVVGRRVGDPHVEPVERNAGWTLADVEGVEHGAAHGGRAW